MWWYGCVVYAYPHIQECLRRGAAPTTPGDSSTTVPPQPPPPPPWPPAPSLLLYVARCLVTGCSDVSAAGAVGGCCRGGWSSLTAKLTRTSGTFRAPPPFISVADRHHRHSRRRGHYRLCGRKHHAPRHL